MYDPPPFMGIEPASKIFELSTVNRHLDDEKVRTHFLETPCIFKLK